MPLANGRRTQPNTRRDTRRCGDDGTGGAIPFPNGNTFFSRARGPVAVIWHVSCVFRTHTSMSYNMHCFRSCAIHAQTRTQIFHIILFDANPPV